MITNDWKWEEFLDWPDNEGAGAFIAVAFTIVAAISGLVGTVLLLINAYFAWYLAILPVLWLYLAYKGFTSAEFFFHGEWRRLELWRMYNDAPKKVRKEIGKVDPKVIRAMSDIDAAVLKAAWEKAIPVVQPERGKPVETAKVQDLITRSQAAATRLDQS